MTGTPATLPDRRLLLLSRDATFNGVDYAEAHPGVGIDVHFINRVRVKGTLAQDRPPVALTVSGAVSPPVVRPVDEDTDWSTDTSGRPVLRVVADLPDAPARYLLTVHSDRLDPCLRSAAITVKGAGDALDCGAAGPRTTGVISNGQPVPVDYLAKDFTSFLAALSNFSAARYPLWTERSEADFGVMLMEVLSALADELSYLQDRVAAEATIGTATQRLSLVRHVRLVDYEPMPALAASTVLQFDVAPVDAAQADLAQVDGTPVDLVPGGTVLPDVIQVQALGGQAGTVDFAAGPLFADTVFANTVLADTVLANTGFTGPVPPEASRRLALDARWNRYDRAGRVPQLVPYLWDPSVTWLHRGATSMWIDGHGHGLYPGQELLIDTVFSNTVLSNTVFSNTGLSDTGATGGDPPNREIARVAAAEEGTDPVQGRPVTLIRWAEGLVSDHDLTRTELAGNLLPAVQGRVTEETFAIPGADQQPTAHLNSGPPNTGPLNSVPLAIIRSDHSGSPAHCLYTLAGPLAWQAVSARDGGQAQPRPALTLHELAPAEPAPETPAAGDPAASPVSGSPVSGSPMLGSPMLGSPVSGSPVLDSEARATWRWVPRLIDVGEMARAFTVTPERYSPAARTEGRAFSDYDGDGATIRFGDGTFGRPPVPGTTFRARYLAGGGDIGNVAADTIVAVAPGDPANGLVWRCTNPFAATGGADAETHAQIRDRAPRQIGAGVLSLTGPADYEAAALSFSPQAIAAARWTGSWLSTTTIAAPLASENRAHEIGAGGHGVDEPAADQLAALAELLDARRLAGADTSVALARYRWLDLRINCEAGLGYRPGDVVAAVLARLAPQCSSDPCSSEPCSSDQCSGDGSGAGGGTGFFGRDNWQFGQPLVASALIAAIQSCPGVAGITRVDYRWAHGPGEWRPLGVMLGVATGEILRIDNDPDQPGHGLLFVTVEAPQ
jgi:hypothetical protein